MALVAETVQINGVDVEVFKITGHPTTDLMAIVDNLSALDQKRLILATGTTLKGRDLAKIDVEGVATTVTGLYLNLLQAYLPEVNKFASDYFAPLLDSLAAVNNKVHKAYVSNHLADSVIDLENRIIDLENA